MDKLFAAGVVIYFTLTSGGAAAQAASAAEIAAIRAEIAALTARLDRLEQGAFRDTAEAPRVAPVAVDVPSIQLSGDLRYRHESIDDAMATERNRHRLRARFGVTADVADNVQVGLQVASGGGDPVSANQTLGQSFDRKPIGIDRAFFSWAATDDLTFSGGKIANPFFRPGNHHLIYDGDLNPEGLAVRYARGDWFASYAGLWVEERGAADDSIMLGGQLGYRRALDNDMRITAGASYYDYLQTQSQTPFFDGNPAGNRVSAAGGYLSDFNITELFAELRLQAGDRPLTVFGDYVRNGAANGADTGFALGASFGEVAGSNSWRVGYAYQDLEADAVIGAFTDSDFAGGGTGGKGHVVELNYGVRDRLVLGLRYFLNERGSEAGDEHDYNRLQADVVFSY